MLVRTALVAAAVLFVAGCGGDLCGRNSPCPNDTPSTQAQKDQCRAQLNANQSAPCYNEAIAIGTCFLDNITCGGDGKTDAQLTATKATNNCTNQQANLTACCVKNPSSTVCS